MACITILSCFFYEYMNALCLGVDNSNDFNPISSLTGMFIICRIIQLIMYKLLANCILIKYIANILHTYVCYKISHSFNSALIANKKTR